MSLRGFSPSLCTWFFACEHRRFYSPAVNACTGGSPPHHPALRNRLVAAAPARGVVACRAHGVRRRCAFRQGCHLSPCGVGGAQWHHRRQPARLDAVLTNTQAEHLVFLGDFLHARAGADAPLWAQLVPWRERHASVQMTLVRGNHDQHAGDPPQPLQIALVDEPWRPVQSAAVLACHHPQVFNGGTVLAGHLHPTARLFGRARDSLRLPCFAWAPGLLVLPAFGAFTGSAPHHLPARTQRFAVTDRAVHPL